MTYVALSRVTKIQGLYLRDFAENKIYAPDKLANYFKTVTKLQIPNTICPLYDTTAFVILFQNIQYQHIRMTFLIMHKCKKFMSLD